MEAIRNAEHTILAPLESLREYEHDVNQELNSLASGHADRSGGMLTLLQIDPEQYPAQRLTHPWLDSTPQPLDIILETAQAAEQNFTAMVERLREDEKETRILSHLGEDLSAGQNIIIITNHGEIKDIAITLASYYAGIKGTAEEQGREVDFSTNILLSKIIPHLGFYGLPAVDVLGMMCDRQYFSFPKTDSIRKTRIAPVVVDTYNATLRSAVKLRLKQGGNLFAIAPSGTVDKPLDDDPDTLRLAPVGKGTAKILRQPNTKVLPVAYWSQQGQCVFEPLDIPRHLREEDDIHDIMGRMAEVLTNRVDGKRFGYLQS